MTSGAPPPLPSFPHTQSAYVYVRSHRSQSAPHSVATFEIRRCARGQDPLEREVNGRKQRAGRGAGLVRTLGKCSRVVFDHELDAFGQQAAESPHRLALTPALSLFFSF